MIKIDLITGFLGAGKTTFIRKYTKYLNQQGYRIGIIENDFGAVNVDMLLLQDLENDMCDIEPIVGGNVASDWKRRFKAKLIAFSMQGMDRVLVEPSGIYDVDTFFEVLYDEPVNSWYEIGSIITIVDAKIDKRLSDQAKFLLMSQIANCGQVVLSKADKTSSEEIQNTEEFLVDLLESYQCDQDVTKKIMKKSWEDFSQDDYEKLKNCGWISATYKSMYFDKNDIFTSLFFMNVKRKENQIKPSIEHLMEDTVYGTIFRIKGFFQMDDGRWIEANATKDHIELKNIEKGQEVVIVIGEDLDKEAIEAYLLKE